MRFITSRSWSHTRLIGAHAVLVIDNWNDYGYYTAFELYYLDETNKETKIGHVRIAKVDQGPGDRILEANTQFENLSSDYFSLGAELEYYSNLNSLGSVYRDEILTALNDIARFDRIFKRVQYLDITQRSFFRYIDENVVIQQYRRISNGGKTNVDYDFVYIPDDDIYPHLELSFRVLAKSSPPTNIHVIIGRNGVGKTLVISNMIRSLLAIKEPHLYGFFVFNRGYDPNIQSFTNITLIQWSAFDNPFEPEIVSNKSLKFHYIGLKLPNAQSMNVIGPRNIEDLSEDFQKSVVSCILARRDKRLCLILEVLETDINFKDVAFREVISNLAASFYTSDTKATDSSIKEILSSKFKILSSGHKIILLSIVKLVITLEEASLVLMDEPESHLHPPLLSAYIRALSNLLSEMNSVAIIATHSPVVLQEVPKSCVWNIRKIDDYSIAERLEKETFGENVGSLTHEIFGLQVTKSGFYSMIESAVNESESIQQVFDFFDGQLGMEAKAHVINLFSKKINNASS